jgi:GNAT superfamily N-acetyltransferase
MPNGPELADDPAAVRLRAWRAAARARVCDVIEPWEHGTVLRATRCPTYYDYNVVRVEDAPDLDAAELTAFADRALAGLRHRRLDFELAVAGEAVRAELVARGWQATRLLWMRYEPARAPGRADGHQSARALQLAREVPYEQVLELRRSWDEEQPDGVDPLVRERFREAAKEVAMSRDARVFAAQGQGGPLAFAQLERVGSSAEVCEVFVHPEHRGRGLGTVVTRAAIAAARDASDLWIGADDEDRAKHLYARLGFRPVCASMEFLLLGR